ncbi:hypothetical protein T4A_8444 [Trichinella pseudospiralis]|uniref:Uncharacterized protein n=1 Tax=Trichinella pseudospiralis TaxID=6337 RepID=A0A0V1EID5_TRIPS|nr:hypothetical protein T4A_8444 [Trichinella pseudospiralis]
MPLFRIWCFPDRRPAAVKRAKRPLSRQCAFNRLTTFGGSGAETVQVCFCWDKNTAGCFCCIGWKLLANRQPCRLLHGEWFRKNKRSDCNFAAGEIPNLTELAGLIPIGDG